MVQVGCTTALRALGFSHCSPRAVPRALGEQWLKPRPLESSGVTYTHSTCCAPAGPSASAPGGGGGASKSGQRAPLSHPATQPPLSRPAPALTLPPTLPTHQPTNPSTSRPLNRHLARAAGPSAAPGAGGGASTSGQQGGAASDGPLTVEELLKPGGWGEGGGG